MISDLTPNIVLKAAAFIGDFAPLLAIVVGIALAGYALLVVRRFI